MARAWSTEAVRGMGRMGRMVEEPRFRSIYRYTTGYQNANKDLAGRVQDHLRQRGILPSRVVLAALGLLVVMQELSGLSAVFGFSELRESPSCPDRGDCYRRSSKDFTDCLNSLEKAFPVIWEGDAANKYTDANKILVAQADKLIDLDRTMKEIIKNQAEYVSHVQQCLGMEQDLLIGLYIPVCMLEASSATFWLAFTIACAAALSTISAGIAMLVKCAQRSTDHAKEIDNCGYREVTEAAQQVIDAYRSLVGVDSDVLLGEEQADKPFAFDLVHVTDSAFEPIIRRSVPSVPSAIGGVENAGRQHAMAPDSGPLAPGAVPIDAVVGRPSRKAANQSSGSLRRGTSLDQRTRRDIEAEVPGRIEHHEEAARTGEQSEERAAVAAGSSGQSPQPRVASTMAQARP